METPSRRNVLKSLGIATMAVGGLTGTTAASRKKKTESEPGQLRKLGHSLLSDPPGGYAESEVRKDGKYALLGSFFGEGGSFLVDLRDLQNPTEAHRLPSSPHVRNADVKFGTRNGLYYRSQEPNDSDAEFSGVEIVDYGYETGTPSNPEIVGTLDAGPVHNLFAHPRANIVYTTNDADDTPGLDIFDVSDPANPKKLGTGGPAGDLHDMVVDPQTGFMHAAYIGGNFSGYAILDVTRPASPEVVGMFDYDGTKDYSEVEIGEEAFENCHYADYDPARGLAIIGDEIGHGNPGGKHVFDIGWRDGSPQNPIPVGYTASPNAEFQGDDPDESYDWTTHNHDVIPGPKNSYLVDGGYHEGTVVYDITDPTDPTPTDIYATDDKAEQAQGANWLGEAPMAWGANYSRARDFVVVSDMFTGVYTFDVTGSPGRGR